MKRAVGVALICLPTVLCGCAQQPGAEGAPAPRLVTSAAPAASGATGTSAASPVASASAAQVASGGSAPNRVVARVAGEPITLNELMQPLIESHGLQILLGLVQLNQARQDVRSNHLTVTAEDIRHEQEMTLEKMFKDADAKEQDQLDEAERKNDVEGAKKLRERIAGDRELLLAQYLDNQHFSRTEFNLKMEINANLRKLAEPLLSGKITDALVEKEFGVEYGETARIKIIQLANMQEVGQARQLLKDGADFGDVSQKMSRNARIAEMHGDLAPFSRQTPGLPEALKELAFSLQQGAVSETLNYAGNFYILKLEQKFAPKAVKFENVKETIRKNMYEHVVQATIEQLDRALKVESMAHLRVEDPVLNAQLERTKAQQAAELRDHEKIDDQWKRERQEHGAATEPSATAPSTTAPTAGAPNAGAPSATEPAVTGPTAPVTAPATKP